jgi:hypothetical protein
MHNGSAGFLVIFLNIWKYIIDKIKGGARGVPIIETQTDSMSFTLYLLYRKHRPVKIPNPAVQEIHGKRGDNSRTYLV